MVLHDHQANPHVHLSVRAESRYGQRLNPRKADLQRRRETFAEKLRGWGVEAEASRQAARGQVRNYEPLWRIKAAEAGRATRSREHSKSGLASERSRQEAVEAWTHIARSLSASDDPADRALGQDVEQFVRSVPFVRKRGLMPDKAMPEKVVMPERVIPERVVRPEKVVSDKAQARPEITFDRGASREAVPASRSQERGR